jgi:hypothetical protein
VWAPQVSIHRSPRCCVNFRRPPFVRDRWPEVRPGSTYSVRNALRSGSSGSGRLANRPLGWRSATDVDHRCRRVATGHLPCRPSREPRKQAPFRRWWRRRPTGVRSRGATGRGVEGAAGHDGSVRANRTMATGCRRRVYYGGSSQRPLGRRSATDVDHRCRRVATGHLPCRPSREPSQGSVRSTQTPGRPRSDPPTPARRAAPSRTPRPSRRRPRSARSAPLPRARRDAVARP